MARWNRYMTFDGQKEKIDELYIQDLVTDSFYDKYSQSEIDVIADCVGYLMADMDITSDGLYDISPEEYYFNAVKNYLEYHSVNELDSCEDDTEILYYCE